MSEGQAIGRRAEVTARGDREIVAVREFDAPRERVFAAFTDPELIPRWWGRREDTTTVDTMEVEPGGAWRFVTQDCEGNEQAFRGTYREIEPPERVVQTFEWEGMPGHVAVETATLEDLGGRTRLVNVTTFHFPEERDGMLASGMEVGMNESYEQLDALLAEGGGTA